MGYIEREAVKEKLSPMLNDPEAIDFWEWQCSEIDDIPDADVRPVVRGKWIKYAPHNSDMMTCSECEKYWILDGDQYIYHYCPNCGADMREES